MASTVFVIIRTIFKSNFSGILCRDAFSVRFSLTCEAHVKSRYFDDSKYDVFHWTAFLQAEINRVLSQMITLMDVYIRI